VVGHLLGHGGGLATPKPAGHPPHLAGQRYIYIFPRRQRTPSRRPAIYNFFYLLPAGNIYIFSLASNIFFFWLLCFSHPTAQPPVTFFQRLLRLRRRCRQTRRLLPTNLPLPLLPQVSVLTLYSLSPSQ
jgi:hypothetical protein